MSRRNDKFSRRALLKRLGMGAALLPILESEWVRAAACSGTSGPRRALFIVWANGMLSKVSEWATAGTGTSFTLPPFMSSLEPYRNDLLLLDGITYSFINDSPNTNGGETTGHACFQGMLTGALYKSFGSSTANNVAGGQSIDQYIGNALKAKGYTGRTSLNTMVYSRSTARLSWTAAGSAIIPDDDPYNVYKTLFPGMTPVTAPAPAATPGTTPTPTPSPTPSPTTSPVTMPIDKMLMMRKSCMDFVLADLNRFSSIISAADRVRVGAHLDAVRAIELQLSNQMAAAAANPTGGGGPAMGAGMPSGGVAPGIKPPPGMACMPPALPAAIATRDTKNFHTVTKMQIDLAVAALAADATRVVVLQLGDQGDPDIVFYNLGFKPAGTGDSTGDDNGYHEMAHQNTENKVTCDTWFQSQMAYAIGALKDVADADKTLLDNSVLVGMNNMRTGIHETRNVPVVMAGSCGGYFGTGRSLKLPSNTAHNNGLLIAVANALGVPTQTFGYASYGGELAGLKA
jgi:hypothetical protein